MAYPSCIILAYGHMSINKNMVVVLADQEVLNKTCRLQFLLVRAVYVWIYVDQNTISICISSVFKDLGD